MELGVKILVTFITVVVLIGIGLGIGLSSLYYDPGDNLVVIPFEPIPEPALRFDCYPEEGASQESCLTRGCYWAETDEQGAPWCYFPKERDVPGYRMVGDPDGTRLGWKVLLQRLDTPVRFDGAVQTLELQVEMHTPQRLRFKLTDSDNYRYEVPTIEVEEPAEKPDVTEYEISYIREPFSLQIIRVSTREVIFDTSVGVLIYEDQFLQISTRLPSSNLYGFGEHNHRRFRHDLNWKTWGIFTRDIGVYDPVNLYGAHPFHMVIEDDGNAHGVFFVNSNAMEVVLQPTPALTYRTIGGVLDFHVILGPTPENVISQYGEIIGRPVMVPYWSLGFQLCRWNYTTLDRVKQVWSDMIEAQIPYDVQYGDIDYMDKQKDFTYDRNGAYEGLPEFVQQVHDHGQRYIIILDHAIKKEPGYHAYDRGLDPNAYVLAPNRSMPIVGNVWPGDSVYPDFFNPHAVDYWTNLTQDFHKEIEFDALWIDMNEPSNFVRGSVDECDNNRWNYPPYIPKLLIEENKIFTKTICMDSHHYTGDHYNLHSLYGHSMSQVTHESLKSVFPSKRSLVFSRSTFAGTGKYAHHWLGDNHSLWEHLWWSIVGMLEFNMFGMPYIGADICGFSYNTTYELCWRWTQLGAFYPYARNHNAHGWAPQHPPVFGQEFVDMTKYILEERYRLLPFLYTLFYHSHLDSATVVRPLANEFPTDPVALDIDRQFLWGPCLMISPVLEEGETSINAYFPDARWFDYFTGEEMRNERGHLSYLYTPMEKINVHVRGGHIIPRQEAANTTVYSRLKPLSVLVALDDNMEAMGDLFWDDGELRDSYENGEYSLLKFAASQGTLTMSIEVTGYVDPNQLTFEHVMIYGADNYVEGSAVIVRHGTDEYDAPMVEFEHSSKVLTISGLDLDMMTPFTITWHEDTTQTLNNELILVTFITVVVLIGIGLGIGLASLYYDPGDDVVVIPFEPIPEPTFRFNCYPEEGASEESCLARGCYWEETDEQGAPWCYFPKERDVPGYRMVGDPEGTRLGWKVLLQRLDTPVRFAGAVQTLELQVEMHTPKRLRFKLTDNDNDRYEVPTIEVEEPAEKPDVTEYEISYIREPFSLQIIRVSTREVIFDTSVGVLIYEDQFLQISTRLPSSNLYGFGEHNHRRFRHDLNWKTWGIFTRDIGVYVNNLYGAHPFHMVIENDGNSHGVFFVNSNAMEVVLQPTPALTYRTIGGVLDFHVFLGPTPENVISQYGEIIGRPVMVPYWSLGFQLCRWNYTTLNRVKQVWSDMIEAQIPYDVQYGDIDYMDKQKDFTYDRNGAYAGLPEFVQQVHDHGQRYIIILDHIIKKEPGYHAYDRGLDPNVYVLAPNRSMPIVGNVWPGDSVYPDFFNPYAADYWTNLTQDFHKEIEFDALWIIGADICGFWGNTTYEMCWRWTQLGAFYPYARNHNADGWGPQHPPVFGQEFVDMTKNILEERYRLLPFLYTLFYHAHLDSATVVRPLANEFPTDQIALDIDRQFLWGPCLMISPVLEEGETSIDAYFPDARWFDYFTGEEMRNERGHLSYLYTPMEKINVHVRGGHIIPRQEPANTTVYSRLKPLSVLVALDDNMEAMGDFFWDDGEFRDSYEKGAYSLLKFAASQGTLTMSLEVAGFQDPNQLIFEHVVIYGADNYVEGSAVTVRHGTEEGDAPVVEFEHSTKVLRISGLDLDMMTPFTITWQEE
ncbi:sucrase-isomaltase, intestinal-like [Diadema setosum]|uniref:sucrase-isomaltase, intestinal-like n=1 Tax=Diadema setosum TaxID=31175 RepID=UPI003B3A985D